ncbi:MAG: glycoside hydrolase family 9 protein, partial [Bacteroidota bacterium]
VGAAIQTVNYQLSSASDVNYTTPQSPRKIGRKSKGTEFANYCEGWQFQDFFGVVGCDNVSPDHTKEHWLYLFLPEPLISGETYQITIDAQISPKQQTFDFTYDEKALKSRAIHINNLGYSTAAELKVGYVYQWLGDEGSLDLNMYDGNAFHLMDLSNNSMVYKGNLRFRKTKFTIETFQEATFSTPNQNFSAADVYECDFSDFNTPGRYRLFIEGIGASNDFEIACNVFRPAYQACMKNLYENRSGIALEAPYSNRPRPAPHNPMITPGFANKLKFSSTTACEFSDENASEEAKAAWEAGIKGDLTETWGWYQDAGDWDAYHTHMKIPALLMFLYEHFPNTVDVDLNIPESDNDLPDVLDEARWLIRFYKRLKDETESKNWTSGGVPGSRIFPDLWGDDFGGDDGTIARGSWEDNDRWWVVSGEDPVQTFAYAASAAQFAFLL